MRTPPISPGRLWPRSRLSLCGHPVGGYQGAPFPWENARRDMALTVLKNWISSSPSPASAMAPRSWPGRLRSPAEPGDRGHSHCCYCFCGFSERSSHCHPGCSRGSSGCYSGRCPCGGHSREPEAPRGCAAGAVSPAVPLQRGGGGRAGAAEARGLPAPHGAGGGQPA